MELNKEQKIKLKNKLISFSEELGRMISGKNIDLNIPLASNYNTYGGLELHVHNTYFGFTTNKTRFITIYSVNAREDSDNVYCLWKYKNDYVSYYTPFILDILMNKEKIMRLVKEKIQYNDDLLDSILGE